MLNHDQLSQSLLSIKIKIAFFKNPLAIKIPISILSFLMLLMSTSCEKEESYTQINGVVYERGHPNARPISNALVFFEWRIKGTYGADVHLIDSTRTNNQGEYSFAAETPDKGLHVYATAHNHYPGGEITMMPNVKRGERQTVNLDLIPYAWVRMHVTKTGAHDYMNINTLPGATKGIRAINSDTIVTSLALGNQHIIINVFKYKGSQLVSNPEYFVQTIGLDTVDISIEF